MKKYIILLMLLAGCSKSPEKLKVGECFSAKFQTNDTSFFARVKVIKILKYGTMVQFADDLRIGYILTTSEDLPKFKEIDCPEDIK